MFYATLILLTACLLPIRPLEAVWIELDNNQVMAALEYGKRYKDYDDEKFLREWMVILKEKADRVGLYTKFNLLALASRDAARQSRELRPEEIAGVLKGAEDRLTFEIILYGDTSRFARNYHAVIEHKGHYIQPVHKYNPDEAEPYGWWPMKSSVFRTSLSYEFSVKDLDPNATANLIIINPAGREREAAFDLSKMR